MLRQIWLSGALGVGLATIALGAGPQSDKSDKQAGLPGPIDSVSDLRDTARMLFKLADTNNNGLISQKEAVDVGNLLVGGFFFRADANGDGVLTPDEARQARDTLFAQQPLLKFVLERAKINDSAGGRQPQTTPVQGAAATGDAGQTVRNLADDPIKTVGGLLDTNHDQKIQSAELRQAVQSVVQTLFYTADTNQDNELSPYELNAAAGEVAKSVVQNVFQAADIDRNGALSVDEYDKALARPAHAAFHVLDANNDNQLSFDEVQRAGQIIVDQLERLQVSDHSHMMASPPRGAQPGTTVNPTAARPPTAVPAGGAPAPPPVQVQPVPRTQP